MRSKDTENAVASINIRIVRRAQRLWNMDPLYSIKMAIVVRERLQASDTGPFDAFEPPVIGSRSVA
jgi:hypothetical protein